MKGFIHSFQSLGTVDGPGVRCVVFVQGCPLRCICCHNPDTWAFNKGREIDTDTLVEMIIRYKMYFGDKGGLTVSGGEPLMQAQFVRELFEKLHGIGINTALDTSGCVFNEHISRLLDVTDHVLLDHKYQTEESYYRYTKCRLSDVELFLDELEKRNIDTWLRRVIIPQINDDIESVRLLNDVARSHKCVSKIELLPFRNLCSEKYDSLGISFPLAGTRTPTNEEINELYKEISPQFR